MRDIIKHHVFEDNDGTVQWVTNKGNKVSYSTGQTWDDLKVNKVNVPWHHVVWFPQANPKHAFIMWLAIQERLTTQDKLMKWYPLKTFQCELCGKEADSINHLFFGCEYSKAVWLEVKKLLLFRGLPTNIHAIVQKIAVFSYRNQIWDVINRITIAATVYNVWQERNSRIFKGRRRSESELVKCIVEGIKLNPTSFKIKNSVSMARAAKNWGLDLDGSRLVIKHLM
ncbi:uncharacterized protein [Rutidosis leptorrhynchoides]|uniref:uncharacterized protein n=1 Tax=Rutidosis leptorrhynchoides TaxID=125765 RepID=UPI003A99C656